jgi:hypothetical protein
MPGVEPTPAVDPTPEVVLMPGLQHFSLLVRVNTLINSLVPLALHCLLLAEWILSQEC